MLNTLRLQLLFVGFLSLLLTAGYAQLKRLPYWSRECLKMFQRLKGAIDSRIAEEQARAKAAGGSPNPLAGIARSNSRTDSPARRPRTRSKVLSVDNGERGPDPSEFEAAFVIEDEDSTPGNTQPGTRTGTPAPGDRKMEGGSSPGDGSSEGGTTAMAAPDRTASPAPSTQLTELPTDVRTKLRKLDKLEAKYHELLRSYRVAHARAVSIEPFEKTLRENTPLTTIKEPEAFVEYLNQLNLKGDMVMDELKRVTTDRDLYKKKFEQSDKEASEAQNKVAELEAKCKITEASQEKPTSSRASLDDKPLPKSPEPSPIKKVANESAKDAGESFFSYDDEIPQLQASLASKESEITALKSTIKTLEQDLSASNQLREELATKITTLETELSKTTEGETAIEDKKEDLQELKKKLELTVRASEDLQKRLAEQENEKLDVVSQKVIESEKAEKVISGLKTQINSLVEEKEDFRTRAALGSLENKRLSLTLKARVEDLQMLCAELPSDENVTDMLKAVKKLKEAKPAEVTAPSAALALPAPAATETAPPASGGAKKRNKKKKKGGAAAAAKETSSSTEPAVTQPATPEPAPAEPEAPAEDLITLLRDELESLKTEMASKDTTIDRLLKYQEDAKRLREKLEEMEENYMQVANEHVEARDQIKELKADKKALEEKIEALEATISAQIGNQEAAGKAEEELKSMKEEGDELKIKLGSLQKDLGAAEELATKRFKELSELKDVLQKAQPELRQLRNESESLKGVTEELTNKNNELKKLESRERDLKNDVAAFKKQASDREVEVKTLNTKLEQETNLRISSENVARTANRDLRRAEADKIEIQASAEKASRELSSLQSETQKLRRRIGELEQAVVRMNNENGDLRREVEAKERAYKQAQSALDGMRGQTGEIATQLREAKENAAAIEEELGECQRLLQERAREGETMRRLLRDVDERADKKVQEMRERLEAATEERDRIEDESGREKRKAKREVEDGKAAVRDLERELKQKRADRERLEEAQMDVRRRREELDAASLRAREEVDGVRLAMGELRAALDASEKQTREAEKQKSDLRRLLDEANAKYEKLGKTLRGKEQRLAELSGSAGQHLRSSSNPDVGGGRGGRSPSRSGSVNGAAPAADYLYLKTVLLQFFEQRDRKLQQQLVPVLGKLLYFDANDEKKWNAAVAAK